MLPGVGTDSVDQDGDTLSLVQVLLPLTDSEDPANVDLSNATVTINGLYITVSFAGVDSYEGFAVLKYRVTDGKNDRDPLATDPNAARWLSDRNSVPAQAPLQDPETGYCMYIFQVGNPAGPRTLYGRDSSNPVVVDEDPTVVNGTEVTRLVSCIELLHHCIPFVYELCEPPIAIETRVACCPPSLSCDHHRYFDLSFTLSQSGFMPGIIRYFTVGPNITYRNANNANVTGVAPSLGRVEWSCNGIEDQVNGCSDCLDIVGQPTKFGCLKYYPNPNAYGVDKFLVSYVIVDTDSEAVALQPSAFNNLQTRRQGTFGNMATPQYIYVSVRISPLLQTPFRCLYLHSILQNHSM